MAIDLSARVSAANAAVYDLAPFAQGITAKDYIDQYAQHATSVVWWKAIGTKNPDNSRDGIKYIKQRLPESVKVLFFNDGLQVNTPEFGKIRVGDATHSGIPSQIELGIYDRTAYPEQCSRITSENIVPSGTSTDNLNHLFTVSIDMVVLNNGAVVPGENYELYGKQIRWRRSYLPNQKFTIRYRYCPQFEFKGEADKQSFIGADGGRMPQIVPVHLVPAGDERDQ